MPVTFRVQSCLFPSGCCFAVPNIGSSQGWCQRLRILAQRRAATMKGNAKSGEVNLNVLGPGRLRSVWSRPQAGHLSEWILLAALLAVFVGRGFLPAWRTLNTDFPNYYLAA